MLKKTKRICPICSGRQADLLHRQKFHLYKGHCLPDSYDVVSCRKCGFVYADTPASQKDYNYFYSDFSKYESPLGPGGRINAYESDKYNRTCRDLAKFIPDRNASILDIGCAKGGLLATLKMQGYNNLTGMDPSPSCVDQVKAQGIDAICGGLFGENFTQAALDRQFDCVVVSHVIEHVYDLANAIKNSLSFVKTGGLLYLEVPDASRYTQYYVTPYHYFDFEHINHFDGHSLNNLMSPYGCRHVISGKKDLQHSNIVYYPAVYSIYRKNATPGKRQKIQPDFTSRENITRYIGMSKEADYWPELQSLAKSGEKIVVWGAGAYALRLYKMSLLSKCNIAAFIDNDPKKQGREFDAKVKIYLPKEILPDFKEVIVVCSSVYNNEIVKEIDSMRLTNRVVVLR